MIPVRSRGKSKCNLELRNDALCTRSFPLVVQVAAESRIFVRPTKPAGNPGNSLVKEQPVRALDASGEATERGRKPTCSHLLIHLVCSAEQLVVCSFKVRQTRRVQGHQDARIDAIA